MDSLLASLNELQRSAVLSQANTLQILAPPGSGKTKTLTARVSHLITTCGVKPWNIIVCTFTVKAAREMKERLKGVIGDGLEKKLILGTFHSVARRFLVTHGHLIGLEKNFGIADTADTKAMIKRIIKTHDLTIDPSVALARISNNKSKNINAEQFMAKADKTKLDQQEVMIVYSEYEAALRLSNLLDYDDLLLRCVTLLRNHPECVAKIEAVLIDEFQDTNQVQFDLMCLLAVKKRTITIVGDPDQSIYGWRNAEIENLNKMKIYYRDTVTIFLEENYRSTGAILNAAQTVIEQDQSRPDKKLQATHGRGESPTLRRLPTAEAEARWLMSEIQRCQAMSGNMFEHKDFAILLRSAQLSRYIEVALGNAGLPYRMVGGTRFFDRVEIKTLLDYLRIINQPDHNDALLRILNVPARNIGEVTVKKLLDEATERNVPIWDLLTKYVKGQARPKAKISSQAEKGLGEFVNIIISAQKKRATCTPYDILESLLERLNYEKFLQRKYPGDFEARWTNVEELRTQTAELTNAITTNSVELEDTGLPTVDLEDAAIPLDVATSEDSLSIFLANVALSSATEQKNLNGESEQEQCITISTIHAAKGLEWPVVFVPACYEGSIPHSRAEDHDEERRLLYVGMTRAQAILYLSCPIKSSQNQSTTLSSFVSPDNVQKLFSAQGPDLEYYTITRLSKTLRRACPSMDEIHNTRAKIVLSDDTYWPLDGSFPQEESNKWNHEKSTFSYAVNDQPNYSLPPLSTGFISASAVTITTEMESTFRSNNSKGLKRELSSYSNNSTVDPVVEKKKKSNNEVSIGTRSISTFFNKSSVVKNESRPVLNEITVPNGIVSNKDTVHVGSDMAAHKLRKEPFQRVGKRNETQSRRDVGNDLLYSTSPTKLDEVLGKSGTKDVEAKTSFYVTTTAMLDTTAPTTTMASLAAGQTGSGRRTLGMGRAFKPWSARGK